MSQSLFNQAITYYQNGQLIEASAALKKMLDSQPNHADGLHLLGIVYYQQQQIQAAILHIQKALSLEPHNLNFLNNYGLVLKANGQLQEALTAYQKALSQQPKDLDVQLNIANLMMQLARFEEAAGYYRRLLRIYKPYQPQHSEIKLAHCHALSQLGNLAHRQGHFMQAEACFAEAVQFNQTDSYLFYNLANAQRELGKTKLAEKNFEKVIAQNPLDADTYNNLGNVKRELGQLDAAIQHYQKALELNPNLHHAKVHLIHQKQHICDWEALSADIATVRDWVAHQPEAQVSPFAFLAMPDTTRQEQLVCASNWVQNRYSSLAALAPSLNFKHTNAAKQKLKIGYLSADFRLHPLAFLITDLIEQHNRNQFKIIAYSFGINDQSKARHRFEKAFDQFHDIRTFSEVEAAQKINADHIDILIDLTGFTKTSRSGIMALRPARIHINWLGFAGTMGFLNQTTNKPLFDYILTDPFITPPEHANDYAEKLAYLPCYQPNDRLRPIAETPSREACQLPDNTFVFCAFNQSFKITPLMFASWMRILNRVPNSVIWLLDCDALAKQNLMLYAKEANIEAARLIFAPRVPTGEHLARHCHADLFLDTHPYNAHTTCSDALWMDVPVLTYVGETFSSRVAGSLLKTLQLDNLITYTLDNYEQTAIALADNPEKLALLKAKIIDNKKEAILFDTPQFTAALETALISIWKNATVD